MFELELFRYFKIHLIIHTALLKSASDNAKLAKIINVNKSENQNYVIARILKKNQIDEINHYLVK